MAGECAQRFSYSRSLTHNLHPHSPLRSPQPPTLTLTLALALSLTLALTLTLTLTPYSSPSPLTLHPSDLRVEKGEAQLHAGGAAGEPLDVQLPT